MCSAGRFVYKTMHALTYMVVRAFTLIGLCECWEIENSVFKVVNGRSHRNRRLSDVNDFSGSLANNMHA